jgi:outer membrane protein, heavy metal efflux system
LSYLSWNKTRCLSIAALTVVGALSGCSTYRAQPVDLTAFQQTLLARSLDDVSVAAFAEQLRQRGADVPANVTLSDGLDLAEAELLTLVFNPTLHAARVRAGAATINASMAGLWDDPTIGVDVLRALEGGPNPWTVLSGVSLSVPISGRLGLAKIHAQQLAEVDRVALATTEWAQMTVLRDAWVTWSVTTEEQRMTAQFAAEARALVTIAEQLQAAGELSVIAARAIRIAAEQAQLQASELEANAMMQAMGIRALIGLLPQAPVQLNPSLMLSPDRRLQLAQTQAQNVNNTAAVRLGLARYQVAEAELRLEVRRQYPDLQLGLAFENDRGERSFGPSFGFTIPLWNGNQRAIARTQTERAAQAADIQAAYIAAMFDRSQATQALMDRTNRLKQLQTTMVPLVDAQVADVRRLAQLGDLEVPLVLQVLESAWQTKRAVVFLQAEQTKAENRLLALNIPAWLLNDVSATGVAP